jgi:hypothetical protein
VVALRERTPESGHCSIQSALRICARSSHAVVSRFRAFTQPMIAGGAPNPMVQDYGPTMREILAATKRRK